MSKLFGVVVLALAGAGWWLYSGPGEDEASAGSNRAVILQPPANADLGVDVGREFLGQDGADGQAAGPGSDERAAGGGKRRGAHDQGQGKKKARNRNLQDLQGREANRGPEVQEEAGQAAGGRKRQPGKATPTPAGAGRPGGNRSQPAGRAANGGADGVEMAAPLEDQDGGVPLSASQPTPAQRAAQLEALVDRAAQLRAAGDLAGAADLLRQGMASSTSATEVARMGLFLAGLADSPAEARRLLSNALRREVVRGAEYELVSDQLRELNRSVRGSLLGLTQTAEYVVQPNDSLWELCNRTFPREFDSSPEVGLIQLMNGMSSTNLQVGQRIAVPLEPMSLRVDRVDHGITAYLGDVALVSYRVGLGKENRTPSGEFIVEVKQKEPTWYRDGRAIPFGDAENILGTRWMGFENSPGAMGYGIHGTAHPESVGSDESMGCVRMRNEEVEELFELVPRGTIVYIP